MPRLRFLDIKKDHTRICATQQIVQIPVEILWDAASVRFSLRPFADTLHASRSSSLVRDGLREDAKNFLSGRMHFQAAIPFLAEY